MKHAALLLLLSAGPLLVRAGSLDDAAVELGRRLSRWRPSTITLRNQTALPPSDAYAVRKILLAELGGPAPPGQAPADIRITITTNAADVLLVAEAVRGEEREVQIVSRPRHAHAPAESTLPVAIEKQFVFAQSAPMLHLLTPAPGRRVILEPDRVIQMDGATRHEVRIPTAFPAVRDLTGRLAEEQGRLEVQLDGLSCQGDLSGELKVLDCQPAEAPPPPPDAVETFRRALGGAAGWDIIPLTGVPLTGADRCGRYLLAAPPAGDQLRAWSLDSRGPQPASETLELGGTLTALWPAPGGAMMIVYEEKPDRYAAYSLALTCSR